MNGTTESANLEPQKSSVTASPSLVPNPTGHQTNAFFFVFLLAPPPLPSPILDALLGTSTCYFLPELRLSLQTGFSAFGAIPAYPETPATPNLSSNTPVTPERLAFPRVFSSPHLHIPLPGTFHLLPLNLLPFYLSFKTQIRHLLQEVLSDTLQPRVGFPTFTLVSK